MFAKLKRLAPLLIVSLSVSACATNGVDVPTDTGCKWSKPITWSEKDTPQTSKEVRAHNAARVAVCKNN